MWKFAGSIAFIAFFVSSQAVSAAAEKPVVKTPAALNFKVQSLDGQEVDLAVLVDHLPILGDDEDVRDDVDPRRAGQRRGDCSDG